MLYADVFLQGKHHLLRQLTLVFKLDLDPRRKTLENASEIQLRRSYNESVWGDSKTKGKFNGKQLFFDSHLEGNAVATLLPHELAQVYHDILISCKFHPNIKGRLLLNVPNDWVKLKVFFCLGRLGHFETHGALWFIVKSQFLSIYVSQQANLKVVWLVLHSHWHFHALSFNSDGDGRWVEHVFDR